MEELQFLRYRYGPLKRAVNECTDEGDTAKHEPSESLNWKHERNTMTNHTKKRLVVIAFIGSALIFEFYREASLVLGGFGLAYLLELVCAKLRAN